ncbi:hypothetical protein [Nocardia heshunensis]
MNSSSQTPSRMRRMTVRLAVAGALTVVPLAALAIPATAATPDNGVPVVTQIADPDWNHDRGGDDHRGDQDHRDHPGDHDRGPDQQQPDQQPAPLPSTGSFG